MSDKSRSMEKQESSASLILMISFMLGVVSLLLASWYFNHLANEAATDNVGRDTRSEPVKRISFCCNNPTDPFFQQIVLGGEREGTKIPYELEWKFGSSELIENSQVAVLRSYQRGERIDALVISPLSGQQHLPEVLQSLQERFQMPIVTIDAALKEETVTQYELEVWKVQINQAKAAAKPAKLLAESIKGKGKGRVLIIGGNSERDHARQRVLGAKMALGGFPEITLVKTFWANWDSREAYQQVSEFLEQDTNIQGIISSNDRMALGAIRALKEKGITGVAVVGFDALPQAIEAIQEGDLLATVDQNPQKQGELGVQVARRLIDGEEVQKFTEVEAILIHKGMLKGSNYEVDKK